MLTPTSNVIARRIGRITFGCVLILGALWLVHASATGRYALSAYEIITYSWLTALLLVTVSRRIASAIRWVRDPDFLFAHSICVPMVGLALMLPITIHMIVLGGWCSANDFNQWVRISMVVTGLPHLALVIAVIVRGRALVADRPAITPGTIYLITIGVSCVPFIMFVLPPLLVALTGLPFLLVLRRMAGMVQRERAELAHAPHVPPRAVVI